MNTIDVTNFVTALVPSVVALAAAIVQAWLYLRQQRDEQAERKREAREAATLPRFEVVVRLPRRRRRR